MGKPSRTNAPAENQAIRWGSFLREQGNQANPFESTTYS
jgi:hypothetical protein